MEFYNTSFAEEYERRLQEEGYPGNLLDAVVEELDGFSSVIDVGAGTGFFSIPLARSGFTVHAVEPSSAMIEILKKKMEAAFSGRLFLHHTDWESWEGKAEKLICVHSLYPMRDPRAALEKMKRSADMSLVIVRTAEGTESLSDILRRQFGVNKCASPNNISVSAMLRGLGIEFHTRNLEQERTASFSDIMKEARYYCSRLGLPYSQADAVTEVLEKNTRKDKGQYIYSRMYRDVMMIF